jgi:protein-S-isoprenylcysteine O-methyltransferase Ste14
MVLCLFPIWLGIVFSGIPFAWGLLSGELSINNNALDAWEGQVLLVSVILLIVHEVFLWRGRLGVVNREVMRTTSNSKFIAMLGVRRLTFMWSLALWQGLFLGCVDALLGRNGHKR